MDHQVLYRNGLPGGEKLIYWEWIREACSDRAQKALQGEKLSLEAQVLS